MSLTTRGPVAEEIEACGHPVTALGVPAGLKVGLPFRLARLSRPAAPGGEALSLTELLKASRQSDSPWIIEVRGVYDGAARYNSLLCSSFLLLYGDTPPPACRP